MKSSYKKLGNYIQIVNDRDADKTVDRLLGVSIRKVLMPSIANIIGTDMSTYKIIQRNQFAYGPVTSRNGDKISVALLEEYDKAIVSQAYTVFEVIDKTELLPEYLMMWFRRPEFDRYARFKSHGSAREIFDWAEMCDTELPIPSIEKQREIVREYNIIQNRIALNNQLISKLEETAQAIYKQWFVDFEFPNDNGKPYKSNGGEMIESELGEIPKVWEVSKISSLCQITSSKRIFESEYKKEGIPFYRAGEIRQKKEGLEIKNLLYISEDKFLKISKSFGYPMPGDILLTAVGSLLGDSYLVDNEVFYFKDGNVIWFRKFVTEGCNLFLYDYLQSENFKDLLDEIKIGSGQSAITIQSLNNKYVIKPSDSILRLYKKISFSINNGISLNKNHNKKLYELQNLLLAKMTKVETEKTLEKILEE